MIPPMSNLRTERERALLTQEELAEKAGVSPATIVSAEAGKRIRVQSKRKILDSLCIPHERHEEVFGPVGADREFQLRERVRGVG